ncbi:MAG: carboxypeptidase-like regulatory domain-containing protein, partial [Flavobacteriaceae bacterium]|nr:carboxypeptidase-like regulatory domain-containing protein [Flavobacteriaceae bacterium]
MKKITLLLFLFSITSVFAQKQISGVVKDNSGQPLVGVNIVEKGTSNGVSTDIDGTFKIKIKEGATLVFSYIGYQSVEKSTDNISTIDVVLANGQVLEEVQVVGSRNSKRTVVNSAVPIDIIDVKSVSTQSGKIEINELLQY